MRKLVILLITAALLLKVRGDLVLQITIIVPPTLITYYEWLTDFPWQEPVPEKPNPFENNTEYGENHLLLDQNFISSIHGA